MEESLVKCPYNKKLQADTVACRSIQTPSTESLFIGILWYSVEFLNPAPQGNFICIAQFRAGLYREKSILIKGVVILIDNYLIKCKKCFLSPSLGHFIVQ